MKARRVFVQLGSNDVDGTVSVDSFIADYKQFLQNIHSAYSYADIIAVSIPPVTEDSANAAETQTYIDQFNQAIAVACSDMGFKYLNSAETLKNSRGFAENSYMEANGYSASGARALLEYAKSHAYNTMDSRPDTSDIPQRASSTSGAASTPLPTATPTKFTASYEVEDSAKGTLTGNGQTGVSSVKILFKHALRNAILPVVTYVGPMLAGLMTGSFVVEKIFSIPGLGRDFVSAITNRDYMMIMGTTILLATLVIVANVIVDILYKIIDPRIKLK